MKSNQKTYFIILAVMLFVALIIFLIFGIKDFRKKTEKDVLIVGNTAFAMENDVWKEYLIDTDKKQNNWKLFQTYVDNEYFGKYYLYFSDKWYLFSEDKKAVNYEGKLLAFNNNKYKVFPFEEKEIEDYTKVNQVLEEDGITFIPSYTSSYYIEVDIDSDGKKEKIYVISNLFPSDIVEDNIFFSIVFLEKDDKIIKLYDKKEEDALSGCSASIESILDINYDNKYELITKCVYYSTIGTDFSIYNFSQGSFQKLVSN